MPFCLTADIIEDESESDGELVLVLFVTELALVCDGLLVAVEVAVG